jgi:hypothetical protein
MHEQNEKPNTRNEESGSRQRSFASCDFVFCFGVFRGSSLTPPKLVQFKLLLDQLRR